jgi:glutathione S-transferase
MRLFYAPGACSLATHIVAREAGVAVTLEKMDGRTHTLADGSDYYAINPKGSVPALMLDDGQVLTEGAVLMQYLADQRPEAGLAPKQGSFERYRLQEWLNFIATDLHRGLSPLFNPKANDELKAAVKERFLQRLALVTKRLEASTWLMGTFTVADAYLFTILWWTARFELALPPSLASFMQRMEARPAVQAALTAEGLLQKS